MNLTDFFATRIRIRIMIRIQIREAKMMRTRPDQKLLFLHHCLGQNELYAPLESTKITQL